MGNVNVRLKMLLTVEDLDEAAKKMPPYRAPGQQGVWHLASGPASGTYDGGPLA